MFSKATTASKAKSNTDAAGVDSEGAVMMATVRDMYTFSDFSAASSDKYVGLPILYHFIAFHLLISLSTFLSLRFINSLFVVLH